jgi:hypothetical protein
LLLLPHELKFKRGSDFGAMEFGLSGDQADSSERFYPTYSLC